jgi:hypothetical protein
MWVYDFAVSDDYVKAFHKYPIGAARNKEWAIVAYCRSMYIIYIIVPTAISRYGVPYGTSAPDYKVRIGANKSRMRPTVAYTVVEVGLCIRNSHKKRRCLASFLLHGRD